MYFPQYILDCLLLFEFMGCLLYIYIIDYDGYIIRTYRLLHSTYRYIFYPCLHVLLSSIRAIFKLLTCIYPIMNIFK